MLRYDAVLFDMDGTLLDTVDDIMDALNRTLKEHGYSEHGKHEIAGFLGNGTHRLITRALPERTDAAAFETVLASFKQLYGKHHNEKTRAYPGILPMLTALGEAGFKLAIISNKSDATVKQLAHAFFGSLIHIAVGARDTAPLKPDPYMLALAMRELNVRPERTLYVGDSSTDFQAAENAGTDCILARWGYGDPAAMEDLTPLYFVNDPAELPMLILREQEEMP